MSAFSKNAASWWWLPIAGRHNRHNCHERLRTLAWRLCRPCRKLQVCCFSLFFCFGVEDSQYVEVVVLDLINYFLFRFVNVEILPPRERRRSRSRSLRRVKRRPRTIAEVMRVSWMLMMTIMIMAMTYWNSVDRHLQSLFTKWMSWWKDDNERNSLRRRESCGKSSEQLTR